MVISLLKCFISYLLLCNKVSQNLILKQQTYHTVSQGQESWSGLTRRFWLKMSHGFGQIASAGCCYLEIWLGLEDPVPLTCMAVGRCWSCLPHGRLHRTDTTWLPPKQVTPREAEWWMGQEEEGEEEGTREEGREPNPNGSYSLCYGLNVSSQNSHSDS